MIPGPELARLLAEADLLAGADNSEIAAFLRVTRGIALGSGTTFIREGDRDGDAAYVLIAGALQVYVTDASGAEIVLNGVEPVSWVGELALLDGGSGRRTASVRTAGSCELLRIGREDFRSLIAASPALREKLSSHYADISEANIARRARSFRLLSESGDAGEESVQRPYQTPAGRKLESTFFPASNVFQLRDLDPAARGGDHRTFAWSDALLGKERHVTLDPQGFIVGVRSSGDWPQLPNLIEKALADDRLTTQDFAGFAQTGALQTAHVVERAVTDPTVCHCLGVDQVAINAAVTAGCGTLDALRRETGCGSVCGGCLPRLREWFGGQGKMPVVARRIDCAAEVASFQLYPREGRYPASEAGQHLVVDGLIGGRWIARRYTITSVAAATDHVEITVQREPRGAFSRWLFDGPVESKVLRVSEPTGNKTWDQAAPETVCVVAGIGVTPAIRILRTAIAEGKRARLHIDYSFTNRRTAAFVDEIQRAATEHPWFTCQIRETSRAGRLTEAAVTALVRQPAGATYHLCGPADFMTWVEQGLKRAGVRAEAIRSETFVHTGKPASDSPFLGARRLAYAAAAAIGLALFPILTWGSDEKLLAIGPMTPGHEALACADCHEIAAGTARQQIQANLSHRLGSRDQPTDFLHGPVTTATCESCHDLQSAVHAPFLFLEPRYQPVRESLGPDECLSCHVEHDGARVSLGGTGFCESCHAPLVLKDDPLDVSHAELTETGQWDTCMGCHDYHGNHALHSPTRMAERLPNATIEDYFRGAESPYGPRKALATPPQRTSP